MIESTLQHLIEHVIDSPVKLHIMWIFHEQSRLEATPQQMAERTCRDIWSVSDALDELAEDGALVRLSHADGGIRFQYAPDSALIEPLNKLFHSYDDPMARDLIQRAIRASAEYAPFRRAQGYEYYATA